MSPLKCPSSNNTRQIMKTFTLTFTEAELDTIGAALDDYVNYHEEGLSEDELIGGLPILDRCNSIAEKIDEAFKNQRIGYPNSRAQ